MAETNKLPDRICVSPSGALTWRGKTYKCAIGKAGVSTEKREGDCATPVGCFPLREIYYRPDRLQTPQSNLQTSPLTPSDGWCDDPVHLDYNRQVSLPHAGRCEELWREDEVYDLIVVIGYNESPPVQGLGSAIFLHIAKNLTGGKFAPTEGCVALSRDDLLEIIEELAPESQIEIMPN